MIERVNIRAKNRDAAMNEFKRRYGRNWVLMGINYNSETPKEKYNMKSYSCKAKKRM
jgi:hypothetical protein